MCADSCDFLTPKSRKISCHKSHSESSVPLDGAACVVVNRCRTGTSSYKLGMRNVSQFYQSVSIRGVSNVPSRRTVFDTYHICAEGHALSSCRTSSGEQLLCVC